jgi:Glycosyltransferase
MSSLGIKILKFSNKIDESIGTIKLETLSLRYYLKPASLNLNNNSNKLKIFFWDRGGIKIKEWIKFFDEKDIDEITYFSKPDYGRIESDIKNLIMNKRLKVNILKENFFTKEKFIQIISKNDVFVCPRKKEGIGMTIVEAISRGMFIIGYNDSTMNEYINESNIGFLFDETTDEKININNILDHYEARKLNAENKYNNWLNQKKDILPLFKKKPTISKKITDKILFMINDINYLFKKILKINYFY